MKVSEVTYLEKLSIANKEIESLKEAIKTKDESIKELSEQIDEFVEEYCKNC